MAARFMSYPGLIAEMHETGGTVILVPAVFMHHGTTSCFAMKRSGE